MRGGRRLPRIADLQDIVDDLEAELLRPISVEDRRWRLLAHSAQPDETDAVRRSSILTRETAPAVAAWLEGLGLQRARELVDLPENEALGMTQRVVLPIRHGDVLLGFLWVIVGDQPLTDADRAAIARGGAEVADNLWGRLREADERRTRINALLAQAFAGEPVAADLAATLRWPETGSFAVAVSSGGDEIAERLRRRRGAADFAWLAQDDRVVILARDPAPSLADELATAGARGGLSARFARLADIPDAIRQADVAAVCAKARPDDAARRRPTTSSAAGR